MPANRKNFSITSGEDRTLTMTARSASGAILNLTGASIAWRLVFQRNNRVALTETGTVISASAGTFSVSISNAESSLLDDGEYYYNALVTISGSVTNAAQGTVVVTGHRIQGLIL